MADQPSHASPYVFLSYASADREPALRIADLLEAHSISIWIDRHSIVGGTSWSAEIVRGIRGSAAVVVLCTPAAMASPNVQQEIQLAWERRRPLLPLILQPVEYPEAVEYAYSCGADPSGMLDAARAGTQAAAESGDQYLAYFGPFCQAWAESRLGHQEAADRSLASARALRQSLGGRVAFGETHDAAEAEIALNAGRSEDARILAERAVLQAQAVGAIFAEGIARLVWGQALAGSDPSRWGDTETQLAASLRCFEEGEARLEDARTHLAWGLLCRDRGDTAAAREHLAKAPAQFEASGLAEELERTRALLAGL